MASGKPFLGHYEVHEQGPVLFIQNENAEWILRNRAEKIRASKGLIGEAELVGDKLSLTAPPDLPIYYMNQKAINLLNPLHQKVLYQAMAQIKPILVVLDPLYLMFDGDISNQKDLNPLLSWLLKFKVEHNCSLIVVHHMGKGKEGKRGGQRLLGSVTLHGWIESALYIDIQAQEETEHSTESILTIEREFRGADKMPKMNLGLKVGGWNTFDYSVNLNPSLLKSSSTGVRKAAKKNEVLILLEEKRRVDLEKQSRENTRVQRLDRRGRARWR